MKVQDVHVRSLAVSTRLSRSQAPYTVSALKVVSVLNKGDVRFVLVGSHGLGGWLREPRASRDVDVVVTAKHLKKATRVLQEAFPRLRLENGDSVIQFRERRSQQIVIDLLKPNALYRGLFKHTHTVSVDRQRYRVPSLEMALTMKFACLVSPLRGQADKHQDAHDFILMVKTNPTVDSPTLMQLGELVYGGGGKGLLEMVRKVRAGEKLVL